MSSITTTSNLGPVILQSLAPAVLYTPTSAFNNILICDKQEMPSGGGSTILFTRPRNMEPPVVQLGNSGLDPAPQVPQRDVISAEMAWFGTGAVINYQVLLQDQDAVLAWVSKRLGVAGKQAEDIILRDYIISASSKINASGGQNGDNPTNLAPSDFSAVAATLDTNNAMKFLDGIDPTIKIGTGAVRPSYVMLSSTELQPDFDAMVGSGFKNQWDYSANLTALQNEYGNIFNIRVLTSAEAPVQRTASLGALDVYLNIVAGKQAVTHISQSGDSMKLLYRGPEYSGMLQQNATLAIRFPQAQALTQDTAIRVLKCTPSSNYGGF